MADGAFYAQKCYAQKCYYWVRDQEKIKSNELVVTTVVIDALGIYDTKFSVKLEMLRQYGKRVFSEIAPHAHVKSEYHKEISMSLIAEHADSMFHANSMPQPDLGPLILVPLLYKG